MAVVSDDICIVCGRLIEGMPDVDDPRFNRYGDGPWAFDTTSADSPYHVACEAGLQLEMFA